MRITTMAAGLVGCAIFNVTAKASPAADAENARYKAELEAGIKKLNAVHVERLKSIQSSLTAAGDLDGAVTIRNQIKAVADAPNSPDVVATSSVAMPSVAPRAKKNRRIRQS